MSDQRHEKVCKMARDLEDNKQLLKSVELPAFQWYDIFGLDYTKQKAKMKRYIRG